MLNPSDKREQEAYDLAHANSDVDNEAASIHHTLGKGPNQAAQGNHKHDYTGVYSPVGHNHDGVYLPEGMFTGITSASANGTFTVGGTRVDVPGCSISVPVGDIAERFLVNGTWDINQNGTTGILVCMLNVNGVEQAEQGVASSNVAGTRLNVSKTWLISGIAPGARTFKLTNYITVAGSYSALAPHTAITVVRLT